MPRQARLDAPGTLHHIIIRGIERRKIVDDHRDRERFIMRLGSLAIETKTSLYAWSLMNNHAHFLVKSGVEGIAKFMRRFLTGYAISYNRRHKRHGHLFQNRYKSIVCDEDAYFLELVRYIHLNPVRAGLVKIVTELDRYAYSGHSVVMGKQHYQWQDRDYVLNCFGNTEKAAVKAYSEFVLAGIDEGKRPDLVGGGLIRSRGGWSEVLPMRRRKDRLLTDERILGSGEFVRTVLSEADAFQESVLSKDHRHDKIIEIIEEICEKEGVNSSEMRSGGRRAIVSKARGKIVETLVKEYGLSMAEVARNVGITTSGIFRIFERNGNKST